MRSRRHVLSGFLTWDQWVQAFVIFMGLTVKTRSAETALHMAKHFELVHELMKAKQDFWYYDVAFRQTLATGGGHWGDIHSESLARARARATPPLRTGVSSASTSAPTKVNGRSSQYTVPVGWCVSYHKYGLCIYPGSSMTVMCVEGTTQPWNVEAKIRLSFVLLSRRPRPLTNS